VAAKPSDRYAIYLRKSRADVEAEARGEGETLARHRRALTELAVRRGYNVTMVYEEIVSGDTIASRPQMQALLQAVESGLYTGVIVNDADRLARGDSIDQGIVKQAFYATGTLIITPYKTYDPANESDEDFFDFSLFMARFEYRKIKQRMQTGRARSAAEGNWIGTRIPYGYIRVSRTDRRGYTLAPNPDTAPIVQMIFRWYAYGDDNSGAQMSSNAIANRLHSMGVKTTFGLDFDAGGIRNILKSPVYIGQTSWAKRVKRVHSSNGVRTETREVNPAPIIVENAHPPIIDAQTWDRVQQLFKSHKPLPKNKDAPCVNPLAGLIYCSECGRSMLRKPGVSGRPDHVWCQTRGCPTTGIYIPTLESIILDVLRSWCSMYSEPDAPKSDVTDSRATAAETLRRRVESLEKQLEKMYDLVEQGIYTPAEFIQRSGEVKRRIADAQDQLAALESTPTREEIIRMQLPQIQYVLEAYTMTDDAMSKNQMLKSVILRVIYHKTKKCTRADNPAEHMTLDVYPAYPS